MTSDHDNRRGALLMMAAMGLFVCNDAMMKVALADLPLGQALLLRGLAASLLTGVIAWRAGGFAIRPSRAEARAIGWRTIGEIGGTACFMLALVQLPLGDLTAILQALPLTATMAAAIFLREQVGWRRWLAILTGFSGVVLIVQPGGAAFSPYALWALASVAFITLRDLTTRRIALRLSSAFVAHITALAIMGLGAVLAVFQPWAPMEPVHVGALLAAALFLSLGYLSVVAATRVGEISFVVPYRYTGLIWAILLGLVFFGEVPSPAMLAGSAIIVAAGLYTFWREQRLRNQMRKRSADSAPPLP